MPRSLVGIGRSIRMVIFAAVGGRMSLIGAIYGTPLVNFGKTAFSESFPAIWLFLMGGLFIAVVMFFPNGLAGLYEKYSKQFVSCVKSGGNCARSVAARIMSFRPGSRSSVDRQAGETA